MGALDEMDLSRQIERVEYDARLRSLQRKIRRESIRLHKAGVAQVFVFEGQDAAGKGGAIRRLTQALVPELYTVVPVAAPSAPERVRHYLWRFWRELPVDTRLVVFDRSWYGRVLVERVEGFATEEEWQRAYREINEFERHISEHGIVVAKFWLQIDADEQMERFQARAQSPLKHWKLTDEDWRNREKWPQYKAAVDEMIERTNTKNAPWYMIEANDKLYARIRILELALERLQAHS